jgi:hypothetical protein
MKVSLETGSSRLVSSKVISLTMEVVVVSSVVRLVVVELAVVL